MKYLHDIEIDMILNFIKNIDAIGKSIATKLSIGHKCNYAYSRTSYRMTIPEKYDDIFSLVDSYVILWYCCRNTESERKLLFKNDYLELNLKGTFDSKWNRIVESFEITLVDGTILETSKLWELRIMLSGNYKKRVYETKYDKLCSNGHLKFIILPYSEAIEAIGNYEDSYTKSPHFKNYLSDLKCDIKSLGMKMNTTKLWCCLILTTYGNQITFSLSEFDNTPTKEDFVEVLLEKINRFCFFSPFELFVNDNKNRKKIDFKSYESEYKHYRGNVGKLFAHCFSISDGRYKNEYHEEVLKKVINKIIN